MFPGGSLHLVNTNGRTSLTVHRRTCAARFTVRQTSMVGGGTGRFAGATGSFAGTLTGSGIARRKRDGSCDQNRTPVVEADAFTMTGTLSF